MSKKKHVAAKQQYVAPPNVVRAAIVHSLIFGFAGIYQIAASFVPHFSSHSSECRVLDCKLTDASASVMPFSAEVLFEFEWLGETHRSREMGIDG